MNFYGKTNLLFGWTDEQRVTEVDARLRLAFHLGLEADWVMVWLKNIEYTQEMCGAKNYELLYGDAMTAIENCGVKSIGCEHILKVPVKQSISVYNLIENLLDKAIRKKKTLKIYGLW